jgi:hypothetical protein
LKPLNKNGIVKAVTLLLSLVVVVAPSYML